MSRIDWIILRRLSARIAVTVVVFFGLLCLVESLDKVYGAKRIVDELKGSAGSPKAGAP